MSRQGNIPPGSTAGPRVLIMPSWWYPNRNAPLSGIFVRRQAEAIAAFCPTAVLFVVPDPSLRARREIVSTLENGLPTVRAYFRPAPPAPWRVLANTLRFMAAAAAGRRALPPPFLKPDLVQVQVTPPVGLVLILRLFWRRTPLVFSEHWTRYLLPPVRRNFLRTWFIGRFSARCAAMTAVSEALARGMRMHGWRAPLWRVIGNSVDPGIFHPQKEKKTSGVASILHISSQKEIKNVAGIVRAMAILERRRSNVRLLIVGAGPTRPDNEALARALGLFDRVVFFQDPRPEKEMAATMRRSDILVLFSEIETFSCVAAEALASGLAVVSTPTAVSEYLPAGSGMVVPFGDEEALAAALEKIIDRLPLFDPMPGRRTVSERFAPREIGRRFYDLFREVLGRHAP